MPRAPWHISSGTPLPNRLSAQIGFRIARRVAPAQIAAELGHGLTAEDVLRFCAEVGVEPPAPLARGVKIVDVVLASKHRTKLAAEARQRGIVLPDFCSQVLSTIARDRLLAAILEG